MSTPFPWIATSCCNGDGLAITMVSFPVEADRVVLLKRSTPLGSASMCNVVIFPDDEPVGAAALEVPALEAGAAPVVDPPPPPPHPEAATTSAAAAKATRRRGRCSLWRDGPRGRQVGPESGGEPHPPTRCTCIVGQLRA